MVTCGTIKKIDLSNCGSVISADMSQALASLLEIDFEFEPRVELADTLRQVTD